MPDGSVTTLKNLIGLTGCSEEKIRKSFKGNDHHEAWELLETDLRCLNHSFKVYRFDNGHYTTARLLGKFYGVSQTTVQRCYRKAGKDPVKANALLAAYHPKPAIGIM